MTVLQNIALSADSVKVRWKQPYVTEGLNQKALSQPKGVVVGFNVVADNTTLVVSVAPDPTTGLSVANVVETTGGKYNVTVMLDAAVAVNLTAQAGTTCYVTLDAQYSVGATSAAQIKVVDEAELSANTDLVVLAKVAVPASAPLLTSHVNAGYRTVSGDGVQEPSRLPVNLMRFGTFDRLPTATGVQGWVSENNNLTLAVDGTISRSATKSMVVKGLSVVTAGVRSHPIAVVPGASYRVSGWLRSDAGNPIASGNGVKLQVQWVGPTGTVLSTTDIEGAFTGGGTTFLGRKALVTAPAGVAFARVRVFFDGSSGWIYVDDLEFVGRDIGAFADHTHTVLVATETNGTALTGYGNGGGSGLEGVSTSGNGVTGTGVIGTHGTGTDAGVSGSGASGSNAVGTRGYGDGEGAGVEGVGGATAPTNWASKHHGAGLVGRSEAGSGVVGLGPGVDEGVSTQGERTENFSNTGVLGVGSEGEGGVTGVGSKVNGSAGVEGYGSTGVDGHGVRGRATGAGTGVVGESSGAGPAVQATATGAGPAYKATVGPSGVALEADGRVVDLVDPAAAQDAVSAAYLANVSRVKNAIINSGFDFWQRGTTVSASHTSGTGVFDRKYCADRWYAAVTDVVNAASGSVAVMTRETTTLAAEYGALLGSGDGAPGSAGDVLFVQEIDRETVRKLRGKSVTLSAFLRNVNLPAGVNYTFGLYTGTGAVTQTYVGGYTGAATVAELNADVDTLTTSYARRQLSGTVGASVTTMAVLVRFGYSASTAGQMAITMPMLTVTSATNYLPEWDRAASTLAEELVQCQRYYEKSLDVDDAPGTLSLNGVVVLPVSSAGALSSVPFKVTKQKVPTITFHRASTSVASTWDHTGGATGMGTSAIGTQSFAPSKNDTPNAVTANTTVSGHWTADAEI